MEVQNKLLEDFMKLYERPTFRKISEMTGINLTRVFRIFNGSTMKLPEFCILKDLIESKQGYSCLTRLMMECENKLSVESLINLEVLMRRKLQTKELK